MTFKSEIKMPSIKEVFNATQKGSKNYKKILQSNSTVKNKPRATINTNWNIERKYDKEKYLNKVFTFWKTPYMQSTESAPANYKPQTEDE